jgi:hypothetical protein
MNWLSLKKTHMRETKSGPGFIVSCFEANLSPLGITKVE